MAWLKFYENEHSTYADLYGRKLSEDETFILTKKLARHYKLGNAARTGITPCLCTRDPRWNNNILKVHSKCAHHSFSAKTFWVKFGGRKSFARGNQFINFYNGQHGQPSIGLVAHEIAHSIAHKKGGPAAAKHKSKIYKRIHKSVMLYCRKKYLNAQLTRPPKPKQEPTKDEARLKKFEMARAKVERYERKVRFYSNKLKRARRSLKALERRCMAKVRVAAYIEPAVLANIKERFNALEEPIEVL